MAGCSVLEDPCQTPEDDIPSSYESTNAAVVQNFIARIWNYNWTNADSEDFLKAVDAGDRKFVPKPIEAALDELRSDHTVRHRRDANGHPVRSTGPDDYCSCINAVHEVAQNLTITILDIAPAGDFVVAHVEVSGINRRADQRTDRPGVYGEQPTGQPFRLSTVMLYHVSHGKIVADWLLKRTELPVARNILHP